MNEKIESFVSVAFIVTNQKVDTVFFDYLQGLIESLDNCYSDYEILLIGQKLNQSKHRDVKSWLTKLPSMRYIVLAREVDFDIAVGVAMENSVGDGLVVANHYNDTVNVVMSLIKGSLTKLNVSYGVSPNIITTLPYKFFRSLLQRVLQVFGLTFPQNSTGLMYFSRDVINSLTESSRFYQKLHVKIQRLGCDIDEFKYKLRKGHIVKKTLLKGSKKAMHSIVFSSTKPLRWASFLGFAGSLLALIFSLFSIVIRIINENVVPGWTTTIVFISMLFAILFIILAFFGEYIARILDDRSEHTLYSVSNEYSSTVLLTDDRLNVKHN